MNVHLSDIAKKVGVSKMTISRVLRDDPAVAESTRKKVLDAAGELGYIPNPKLARLMSEMAQSRSHASAIGELAYITTESSEFGWKRFYHQLGCYEGAKEEALAYGYNLIPVWALSRRFGKGRLTEFLWSRGVDGLIIQPLGHEMIGKELDIDWNKFCSVQIGATLSDPMLNLVRHNHHAGMMQCLLEMEKLGYERIGLCFSNESDTRSYHRWASAYLYWRTIRGFTERTLPSFHYVMGSVDRLSLKQWIERYQITGIIGMSTDLLQAILNLGIRIPEDLGFSVLDHPGGEADVAGIDQTAPQLGSKAVDLLMVAVRKGTKGVPKQPVQTIVEGEWIPGKTVRRVKRAVRKKAPMELTDITGSF